jgi:ABC-2 type transport system permease protein
LLNAKRERLPQILLAIFLAMTALSCFIGWATNRTVTNVYNEAIRQGITHAANPFTGVTPLYYARNTVIYIVLVGALLAIILGVQSTVRDRKAHVSDLLLSRPVAAPVILAAKLAGVSLWLFAILMVSAGINWASISFIGRQFLSLQDSLHLLGFYLIAWLFLVAFTALGMITGLYARRETSALLVPIIIWSAITFVLPQLGTAEHPVSLLNPVPAQIVSHGFFFHVNQTLFGPLSLTEHFKTASGIVLHDSETHGSLAKSLGIICVFVVVSVAILLATRRQRLRSDLYE